MPSRTLRLLFFLGAWLCLAISAIGVVFIWTKPSEPDVEHGAGKGTELRIE